MSTYVEKISAAFCGYILEVNSWRFKAANLAKQAWWGSITT
jgi:hypothetical protein